MCYNERQFEGNLFFSTNIFKGESTSNYEGFLYTLHIHIVINCSDLIIYTLFIYIYIYIDKKKESKYHGVIDHETIEMRTNDRRKKRNSSQLI